MQQTELESKRRPGFALPFCSCVSLTEPGNLSDLSVSICTWEACNQEARKACLHPSFLILFPMGYSGIQIPVFQPIGSHRRARAVWKSAPAPPQTLPIHIPTRLGHQIDKVSSGLG